MMEHEKYEIHVRGDVIEFVGQPLALRSIGFRKRAVKRENQRVGGAHGVVAAVLQIGKALEIVAQRDLFVSMQVMVSQSWIDWNFVIAPDARLLVPDLPIVLVVSVVDDVASETNKSRIRLRD